MENAADALKMVLGIFMFVLGLSLFFFMINQVKATSDVVLFMSDKTNFYDMDKLQSDSAIEDGIVDSVTGDRIVGLETIIPNIYAYSRENTGITIIDKEEKAGYKFIRYSTSDDGKVKNEMKDYILKYVRDKLNIKKETLLDDDIMKFYNSKVFLNGANQAMWSANPENRAKRIHADVLGGEVKFSSNEDEPYKRNKFARKL